MTEEVYSMVVKKVIDNKTTNRRSTKDFSIVVDYQNEILQNSATFKLGSLKIEEAEWLTSKEAAEYLRVSEATLRNMASNGQIPYAKLGRSNRYNRIELYQLLQSHRRGARFGN